jgi:osmotically inducible protein OsmC
MAEFRRRATAVWNGDLRSGKGRVSSYSGVHKNTPYSYTTRFDNEPGTNPEEMLAAALASCYSMALSGVLSKAGHKVDAVETEATCFFTSQPTGGFRISRMHMKVTGRVAGIDQAGFAATAKQTEVDGCPVSALLHAGVPIELDATLAT